MGNPYYSCERLTPAVYFAQFWDIVPKQTYWANEDFSTIGGEKTSPHPRAGLLKKHLLSHLSTARFLREVCWQSARSPVHSGPACQLMQNTQAGVC